MKQSGNNAPSPVWVSVNDAISMTSIGRTRLYELLDAGTLKSIKIGKKRLIEFQSIRDLGKAA